MTKGYSMHKQIADRAVSIKSATDLQWACRILRDIDPVFTKLYTMVGHPKPRWTGEGFAGLINIILGQQISVTVAESQRRKLYAHVGLAPHCESDLTPEHCINRDDWRDLGLSKQKINYIGNVTDAVLSGALDLDVLSRQSDEDLMTTLTQIKGIGPWTAESYAMFCEGRCDLFPAGDLGIKKGIKQLWGFENDPTEAEMRALAEQWRPYRGVACVMIWQYCSLQNS